MKLDSISALKLRMTLWLTGPLKQILQLPEPCLKQLAGPDELVDGQLLAVELRVLLRALQLLDSPMPHNQTPELARQIAQVSWTALNPPLPSLKEVRDLEVPGGDNQPMAARLYIPHGLEAPHAALVYFHGGGWVLGDLDTHDAPCRVLADAAKCSVFSIDYRLAPEHPFPAAVQDAIAATRWVFEHASRFNINPQRIAVGGDSAGGNLAAVTCQELREAGEPLPAAQLLFYPGVDFSLASASMKKFSHGYMLEQANIDWFKGLYLGGERSREQDPKASPLLREDLRGLPQAIIATAGFDVLRDEGQRYAERLREAGVPVSYRCHSNLIHGFANFMGAVPAAKSATLQAAEMLRRALLTS